MKFFILMLFVSLSFISCNQDKESAQAQKTGQTSAETSLPEEIQEEDCEDKVEKKMKEVEPTKLGLGTNAGCTLE